MSEFSSVVISPCADYSDEACRAAIRTVVEASPFLQNIRPGMKIIIKVNLVTLLKPEKAATTHPALLTALVAYLHEKGAEVVIGDSPGGLYTKTYMDSVYTATGMKTAAAAGAALNWDFSVSHAEHPDAAVLKDFDYTSYLDGADAIINFCKLKSHGMMGLSCAVKNMFGAIPGLTKPAYHYRFPDYGSFADMLIDLNTYFKPAFCIADAVIAMEGNGPTMGTPRFVGAVLASESPYALDLAAAKLIGLTAKEIPTLAAAHRRGLAPETAEELTLIGALEPFIVPDFDTASADSGIEAFVSNRNVFGRTANKILKDILAVKPRLQRTDCVSCGKCAGLCPANAIRMRSGKPQIDRSACIRCFCCQEFCPKGALVARRSSAGDFLLKHTQH